MGAVASISNRVGDVGGYLREQREHARLSLRQLATLAGVSNPYLSQVERGLRKPSAEVLQQIAHGLRISAEALYVRAGILEEDLRHDVEAAVQADPVLTDRQKRVLLDIYAAFRAENAQESSGAGEPTPRRRAARKAAAPGAGRGSGSTARGRKRAGTRAARAAEAAVEAAESAVEAAVQEAATPSATPSARTTDAAAPEVAAADEPVTDKPAAAGTAGKRTAARRPSRRTDHTSAPDAR
jgi:transcriptional regulator with XRE-family HTH domain